MHPTAVSKARFFLGPDRRTCAAPAEDHFEFTLPDYPQASAEEFAAAAASTVPLTWESSNYRFSGTCILTEDDRVVAVNAEGHHFVTRLKPEGAALARASMGARASMEAKSDA